jgi:hypothetical protein
MPWWYFQIGWISFFSIHKKIEYPEYAKAFENINSEKTLISFTFLKWQVSITRIALGYSIQEMICVPISLIKHLT